MKTHMHLDYSFHLSFWPHSLNQIQFEWLNNLAMKLFTLWSLCGSSAVKGSGSIQPCRFLIRRLKFVPNHSSSFCSVVSTFFTLFFLFFVFFSKYLTKGLIGDVSKIEDCRRRASASKFLYISCTSEWEYTFPTYQNKIRHFQNSEILYNLKNVDLYTRDIFLHANISSPYGIFLRIKYSSTKEDWWLT